MKDDADPSDVMLAAPAAPGSVPEPRGYVEFPAQGYRTAVERFEQQVALHGDRTALRMEHEELTYRDFNACANRIAHAILERLPPASQPRLPDDRRLLEDSAEPVVVLTQLGVATATAQWGVFKAGKAYVPLDCGAPRLRTRRVFDELAPRLIVADAPSHPLAVELAPAECPVINLDTLDPALPDTNPDIPLSPDDLAFIVYTSGSTGRPKGVMHTHRSLLHDNMVKSHLMRVCASDRFSLVGAGTGQALKNITLPLLNGAALHPKDIRRDGAAHLGEWLRRQRITVFIAPPSLFRSLVDSLSGTEHFSHLRMIRLGGDRVFAKDVASFQRHFALPCTLINLYSSSETGSICAFVCDSATKLAGTTVPAGYPLGDVELSLLGEEGNAAPSTATGEVAVRSTSVSAGYWRQPELTGRSFLSDPAGRNGTVYRSADLGRWRDDGMLELLGRRDFQAKVRGFSVSLAEIETALVAHAEVESAVVHSWTDERSEARLAAYIVARAGAHPTVEQMRAHLAESLPKPMIPAFFVFLDALPLLPGGKVDRTSLPHPTDKRPELSSRYEPPRTPSEHRLIDLWTQVLRRSGIGVHDGFFDLGGDSLLAAVLSRRIMAEWNVDSDLRDLLLAPTVAAMARLLEQRARGIASASDQHTSDQDEFCQNIRPGRNRRPLACVGDSRPIPLALDALGDDVPVWHLKLDGVHVWPPRHLSLEEQAEAQVRAIEGAIPESSIALVGFSYGGLVAYRVASALRERGWRDVRLLLIEPAVPRRQLPIRLWLSTWGRALRHEIATLAARLGVLPGPSEAPASGVRPDEDRWRLMQPRYRRNVQLAKLPRAGCPIHLIATGKYIARSGECWRAIEPGNVTTHVLAGANAHLDCVRAPFAHQVAGLLRDWYDAP
jgi:amino acid adenylation domain-containing protein